MMNILAWLKGQNWNHWVGSAIMAVVILFATMLLGGFLIPGAVPFASIIAVLVFFGMPELVRITPTFLWKFIARDARPDWPLPVRLFRVSGAAITVLVWALMFWV